MKIKRFLGLNNVTDPLRLPAGWLSRADNVNITDTGAVVKRAGFEPVLQAPATVRSAFANKAMDRLYLHAGDEVLRVMPDMSTRTLAAGAGAVPLRWDELNKQSLFVGPEAAGIITADDEVLPLRWDMPTPPLLRAVPGVMPAGTYRVCWAWVTPDGRETGVGEAAHIDLAEGEGIEIAGLPQLAGWRVRLYVCPAGSTVFQHLQDTQGPGMTWGTAARFAPLGRELSDVLLDPLPVGVDLVAVWGARLYAAQHLPEQHATVVWFSEPMAPHLFNLAESFFSVPGRLVLMAPTTAGLLLGTDDALYGYTADRRLVGLADYGAVPGWSWAADGNAVLFWSRRGLCRYPEFANLTERRVSVAPGLQAGAAVIQEQGQKRFVVALQAGGDPFNPYQTNP